MYLLLLKIDEFRLREAEDRYERRESRPEDLNAIRELKSLVQEKESLVQKLVVSFTYCLDCNIFSIVIYMHLINAKDVFFMLPCL